MSEVPKPRAEEATSHWGNDPNEIRPFPPAPAISHSERYYRYIRAIRQSGSDTREALKTQ